MMKVGKVTLTDTWYHGKDLYSDGQVEDEMLRIAREIPREDWNREIVRTGSWPVLYHFSHVRENIVRWLPLDKAQKVLEIGAGCGAVTGALCEMAGQVDAVELSMKRSLINAYRNPEAENLTIYVGNFEELETHLDSSYDIVTLIGVFEYAQAYIHGKDPYREFLKTAASHLKPGGRIILAIENRFGLKYWAGCTEDHTGELFEGLEGYRDEKRVRTFTHGQMQRIVDECGLHAAWYYPYPDYKFPQVIHSDGRLPVRGEFPAGNFNFDRLRLRLFDEAAVADGIVEDGHYPEFANSFLLVLGKEPLENLPVYTKFSNERSPACALMTQISGTRESERTVCKKSLGEAARRHVAAIAQNGPALQKIFDRGAFLVNRASADEADPSSVRLEYLSGTTLEEELDAMLTEGKREQAEELLLKYAGRIRDMYSMIPFEASEEAKRIFGLPVLPEGIPAAAPCDIDLVPANILKNGEGEFILDTEWTFSFPVPAEFVVYRFLWYYLKTDPKRGMISPEDVFEKAGIPRERMEVYAGMERRFQASLTEGIVPMREMYDLISPGEADVLGYFQLIRGYRARRTLKVFYDAGEDFREENSACFEMDGRPLRIPVPEGTVRMRMDPGEEPGLIEVEEARWADGEKAVFTSNGSEAGKGKFYFLERDPQFLFETIPEKAGELLLNIRIPRNEKEAVDFMAWLPSHERSSRETLLERQAQIAALENRCGALTEQLTAAQGLIREMESTKAWRLYQRLRKLLGCDR